MLYEVITQANADDSKNGDNVQDADFEEVK